MSNTRNVILDVLIFLTVAILGCSPSSTTYPIPPPETPTTQIEESEKRTKFTILIRDKETKSPLQDVKAFFSYYGPPAEKFTDTNGYVEIEIPSGRDIQVTLSKPGYVTRNFTINSRTDIDTNKNYWLEKDSSLGSSTTTSKPSPRQQEIEEESKDSEEIPHVSSSPASKETIQTPSSTPTQTPEPEPTISGKWEGKYTCSQGLTGVTVNIAQTGNKVVAEFILYSLPENSDIPRGVTRYEGPRGIAKYEGNFNFTSRLMYFPRGKWTKQPALFWTAFGFEGVFDENLETFSGTMNHYSCTSILLKREDS